ncbi:hypothetical protein [Marinobacterium rhizophilum]|uniref:Uncharacterized protein n=1 Tax=Marinobacterium rhizophilum TaxID=420402 RepID=A0ABY5HSG7_9GAMM|nr:hypothetical protein [Marinobacterium rhizophilum]UTW13896.1 hypothetical protein KDW95_09770 [Marinobacterium rhizophilum]
MRLQFFQRLLDQLHGSVAVMNQAGTLLLVSELAQRQFVLTPGLQVEVLHREGDRILLRQPTTQQLHSAQVIRWLKLEFLLFQRPPREPLADAPAAMPADSELIEFCARTDIQSRLEPQQRRQLQRLLEDAAGVESVEPVVSADLQAATVEPLGLIEQAFAPALEGVDEFFLQAPSVLGSIYGDRGQLASALRSLVVTLVTQRCSRRLLVRLHQIESELLITVQDIGDLQLPRMTRLGTDEPWSEPVMHSPEACAVIERHGGQLRLRGDMAQGRVTFSFPIAVKNVFD